MILSMILILRIRFCNRGRFHDINVAPILTVSQCKDSFKYILGSNNVYDQLPC